MGSLVLYFVFRVEIIPYNEKTLKGCVTNMEDKIYMPDGTIMTYEEYLEYKENN